MSQTIQQLSHSSSEIGSVVSFIQNIAAQTNLLALNATIEAARAGDAGKGFAVVAGEVKGLAQETAQATADISQRIAEIQSGADRAATSVEHICAVLEQVQEFATTIASSVEQQVNTTNEISSSIGFVASSADSTTQVSQESTDSATALADMAQELRTIVGRFQLETVSG
jgi:methyl-accepting chemotaxis protein